MCPCIGAKNKKKKKQKLQKRGGGLVCGVAGAEQWVKIGKCRCMVLVRNLGERRLGKFKYLIMVMFIILKHIDLGLYNKTLFYQQLDRYVKTKNS